MGLHLGYHVLKLHLGFEEHAYEARYSESSPLTASAKKRAPKRPSRAQLAYGQGKTTTDVQKELEDRYKIVETFFEMNEDYIVGLVEDMLSEDIETVMSSEEPSTEGLSFKETDKIETRFRRALSSEEFNGVIPGVPTRTARQGVSHLRRHPYAARSARPSFIDTGLYQRSFRAWVEED